MSYKPSFRDWVFAGISLAFVLIGLIILPSNRNVGITTLAFFGACAVVAVAQLRRKLRHGRMNIVSVDVVEGFRLERSKRKIAVLGAGLAALGVVLLVFSPDAPLYVGVCYWVIAVAGALVLAMLVSGRLPAQALEFQSEGLIFENGKWSVLLPWNQITEVAAGEMQSNPALLMSFDFAEVPRVSPPEMQEKFLKYMAQCQKWAGADFSMLTTHYHVDLPVLVAAINQFRMNQGSPGGNDRVSIGAKL
ncbi:MULTISPECIES: hypothetical protein [unclassified Achromobacter]|uniref:hypothetical protein n=1 Tax=unclassified Achromobacter TaxID=2626865 RepID=UPI000B51E582|nr:MULTISPECIES: hypothetical protein [unclassified Achromobacter]OWT75427.1 hypothetical protein CEY04_17715 [Achromobacter sp. HZ28]OWT76087.1 hypothetical protein CEY05_13165 [Achromobacter sp. HZ34]